MTLIYNSAIEVLTTDKKFIVIKQTAPQVGTIGIHISELEGFIGMLKLAENEAMKPEPSFLTHPKRGHYGKEIHSA